MPILKNVPKKQLVLFKESAGPMLSKGQDKHGEFAPGDRKFPAPHSSHPVTNTSLICMLAANKSLLLHLFANKCIDVLKLNSDIIPLSYTPIHLLI